MGKKLISSKVQTRVQFLSKLILNPKFYNLINEPLTDIRHLDMTLSTLCYASLLLSYIIKKIPRIRNNLINFFVRLKLKLHNYVPKFISNPILNDYKELMDIPLNYKIEKLSEILRSLSSYISDIRLFNRMWSLPATISFLIEDTQALIRSKDYLELFSTWCIAWYQPLENVAFALDHGWGSLTDTKEKCSERSVWWYVWSSRLWGVWVVFKVFKILVTIHKNKIKDNKTMNKHELISLVENLATLPLCVHWSLNDGCLGDLSVGLFGTIAGGLSTACVWNDVLKKVRKLE